MSARFTNSHVMNPLVTRRHALRSAVAATAVLATSRLFGQSAPAGPHKLPPLGYAFDALEPAIDAKTMEIHHGKHHAAYVTNLNKALADYPDLQKLTVEELLGSLDKVPEKIRTTVRNNAGGHYNHSLLWKSLKANGGEGPNEDVGKAILQALEAGTAEEAKEAFVKKALAVFGSGWLWISVDKDKSLKIEAMPNQDNPLMFGRKALFGIDLWEHAYYLKYQNRRIDYVQAYPEVINWDFVGQRFTELTA
jgi:Fe-Mn family superoxide dismutase